LLCKIVKNPARIKNLDKLIPKPLVSDITEGKCLAFIGAGFSMNAILPDGEIMPDWEKLGNYYAEICGIQKKINPLEIAQIFENRFGRVQLIEHTRKALFYDKVQTGEAHKVFATFPFDVVYTTNFDLLLEKAYSEIKRPYRSIVGELQMPFFGGKLLTNIVKMHGDLEHEEHLIISKEDYKDFLSNYPVIATHLSSLLITRTPLFIGYSLTDPDFKNIRDVVRSRLGKFERMSYVIQFDSTTKEIEDSLKDNLHIISIPSKDFPSKSQAITQYLNLLLENIDRLDDISSREFKPNIYEKVERQIVKSIDKVTYNAISSSTSNSCFVLMPFNSEMDEIYEYLIAPAIKQSGLTAIRADNINRPGSIIEQIRTSIRQSRLLIADVSTKNPNVMYEIGLAQAMGKPIIFISEGTENIPFDIRHLRVISYSTSVTGLNKAKKELINSINITLKDSKLSEAERLMENGQVRASMAIAGIALEQILNNLILNKDSKTKFNSNKEIIGFLEAENVITKDWIDKIKLAYSLRNNAIHKNEEPTENDARLLLSICNDLINYLKSNK
jgi:uncharacterized protein YutE (UPF0331/DUF86 family)